VKKPNETPLVVKLYIDNVDVGGALQAAPAIAVVSHDVAWLFFIWLTGFAIAVLRWLRGIAGLRRVLVSPNAALTRCLRGSVI